MRMPRFTAEASLYKTSENYQMARTSSALTNGGELLPQLYWWHYCDAWGCYICTDLWGCTRTGPGGPRKPM
jgi:hypothetical protein